LYVVLYVKREGCILAQSRLKEKSFFGISLLFQGLRKSPDESAMKSDSKETYERFCSLLIEKRKKSGLSQQEVADKLSRPQTYVSKCELGTRRMDVIEFLEMSEAVRFDPVALIRKLKSG
jgi:ribosome-binding protein aMBF1 (putative translation factor)